MKKVILSLIVMISVSSIEAANNLIQVNTKWNHLKIEQVQDLKNYLHPLKFKSSELKNVDGGKKSEYKNIVHGAEACKSSSNSVYNFVVAKDRSQKTIILWTSKISNEYDFYVIEKSVDGTNYESIGIIETVKFSQRTVDYSFVDMAANESTAFYRIRQEKRNGIKSYSQVVEFIDSGAISQK